MIRRAAKRDRQCQPVERRQKPVEQRAILDGELPGQPVLRGIVEIESRLHRGKIRRAFGKGAERLPQLTRLGSVFGIVDDNVFAARERQRVVQRLGLGAWRKVRYDHDLEIAGEA